MARQTQRNHRRGVIVPRCSGRRVQGANAEPVDGISLALEAVLIDPPDLLISDVVMNEISGVNLAIPMTAKCPDCKVLLFSGSANTANLLEEARLGS